MLVQRDPTRSSSTVKVIGQIQINDKCFLFGCGRTLRDDVFHGCTLWRDIFLVVCRVLYAKVVGATSSEEFLKTCSSCILTLLVGTQMPSARQWSLGDRTLALDRRTVTFGTVLLSCTKCNDPSHQQPVYTCPVSYAVWHADVCDVKISISSWNICIVSIR